MKPVIFYLEKDGENVLITRKDLEKIMEDMYSYGFTDGANTINDKNLLTIKYYWNNDWHLYYPDFLLIDFNILLEVKGYKTERDDCKWASVKSKFAVIEKQQIKNLDLFFEQLFKKAG